MVGDGNECCVVCDRELMKVRRLQEALQAVDDALKIYDEDPRISQYRKKIVSKIAAAQ